MFSMRHAGSMRGNCNKIKYNTCTRVFMENLLKRKYERLEEPTQHIHVWLLYAR